MIAVLISANSEWKAALEFLDPANLLPNPYTHHFFTTLAGKPLVFMHGGWGKVSAAATAQYCIDIWKPDLIINLGTCGGLAGTIQKGETILVSETVIYDIFERMSDPDAAVDFYTTRLDLSFLQKPYPQPVKVGRIASGDQDINPQMVAVLKEKFQVNAADWESGSIAWTAGHNQTPCLILRTISDVVSETGGEIYFDGAAQFDERSRRIMSDLLKALPDWIACAQL